MNRYCHTLSCHYGAQFNPRDDTWAAIKVYRDGVPIVLASGLPTEEDAEQIADMEYESDLLANAQFGVGT